MFIGYLLIVVGAWFLLENLGLLANLPTGTLWPVVIIVVGVWMVGRKRGYWCECGKCYRCKRSGIKVPDTPEK